MDITEQLINLKERIDSAKTRRTQLEERLKLKLDELSKKFGCKSILEAEDKIKTIGSQVKVLEAELEKKLKELARYDWETTS